MASNDPRIEQFRKMAQADPNNELGHFSLGRALLDAGEYAEAAASLGRVVELNSNLAKAYHLLGTALLRLGRREDAVREFTRGAQIADQRGDIMPRDEMIKMLKELGAPIPTLASATAAAAQPVGTGEVLCKRCGRVAARLPRQPFSNAQGKLIFEGTCAACWKEWIGMGTKVINELRLPLSDPQASRIYDQHMMEFLNLK